MIDVLEEALLRFEESCKQLGEALQKAAESINFPDRMIGTPL